MALKIKNLFVSIEEKEILNGVGLHIKAGEVVALMGPNGSGKSSLALALMGHPKYKTKGEIELDGISFRGKSVDERAKMGLFLAFQYPVSIEGVTIEQLLRKVARGSMSALEFRKYLTKEAKRLGIKEELIKRSINDGFSGGEKKRLEILQMAIIKPKYAILDETDSGLDIDALKVVASGVNRLRSPDRAILIVTHYQRLLNYITPDFVHVLVDGRIVLSGDKQLAFQNRDVGSVR